MESGVNLARCYEACGEFPEGLIIINEVLAQPLSGDTRARALLRKAVLQKDSPLTAWKTIQQVDLDSLSDDDLIANIYNQRGRTLKILKKYDRAIIEYTAAGIYWEHQPDRVGHSYNNIAGLYLKTKQYKAAHEFVDKAIRLWSRDEHLPCALDQKAQIHLAEKEYAAAYALSIEALKLTGDRQRWRVEWLGTIAQALAGLGRNNDSLAHIEQALTVCDYLGDESLRIQVLLAQKRACEIMYEVSDAKAIELALELSDWNLRAAARQLGINHSALIKAIDKRGIRKSANIKRDASFSVVRKGT